MPITYRIHPAIGVARVGDSLTDYFVGPEAPGVPSTLTFPNALAVPGGKKGTYKHRSSHVNRQGARFRIYEYTSSDAGAVTKVREITAADARSRTTSRMPSSRSNPAAMRMRAATGR